MILLEQPTIFDALNSLRPGAQWHWIGTTYDGLNWLDEEQIKPTQQALETELANLQTQWEQSEYQRLRKLEYPSIGDQLDALWKGGLAAEEMLAKVQAVKNKYPKE
jgi:hypothetical protein